MQTLEKGLMYLHVSAACADSWRIASSEWNKKQEDSIMTLETQLNNVTALWRESQQSLGRIQEEVSRLNSKVSLLNPANKCLDGNLIRG